MHVGVLNSCVLVTGEDIDASRGTESNQAIDCRYTITDLSDIREERDQEQAMAYFEHELNDYVTLRGEAVSRLDYTTRTFAPSIDEWPTVSGRTITRNQSPSEAIQATRIGHLPTARIAVTPANCRTDCLCADYVPGHVRDLNDEEAARAFGYELVVRYSFRLARLITTMPTAW